MQEILTGAGVKLMINGRVIGFATGISFRRSQGLRERYEIDNPIPVEIYPTTYSVSGSLEGLRIRSIEGLDGAGITSLANIKDYFEQKYCVIEIVDRLTSVTLYKIVDVLFDDDSWRIQSKQIINFSASFRGRFLVTELTS